MKNNNKQNERQQSGVNTTLRTPDTVITPEQAAWLINYLGIDAPLPPLENIDRIEFALVIKRDEMEAKNDESK